VTALVIAVGGALGAVSRYYVTAFVVRTAGGSFPYGTMVVNVLGSFALGFLLVWLQSRTTSAQIRQFVGIGFLGSFTTFSTFSLETVELTRAGEFWRAGGYAVGSLAAGVVAVILGAALATALEAST